MRMRIVLFIALCQACLNILAQSEVLPDSTLRTPSSPILSDEVRSYDGFLLDMGAMNLVQPVTPKLTFNPNLYETTHINSAAYQIQDNVKYGVGDWQGSLYHRYSLWDNSSYNTATFKLKNGMTLTTYGDYDSSGRRTQYSTLPWRRNDFRGAFELKSKDSKLSFRMEMHYGHPF